MQEAVEIAHHGLQADFGSVLEYDQENDVFVVRSEVGWPITGSHRIPGGTCSQSGYAMLTGKSVVSQDLGKEHRFAVSESVRKSGARSGMSTCIQAGDRPLGVVSVFHRVQCEYTPDDVNFLQSVANVLTAAIERQRVENDLRRARADAEAANRGKSEFLSRMSHELRTPLNAILGFTQLLEMEEHNARQAESIQHITRAGQNLLSLINEVLDIARIDAGRMQLHIEPVELPEILREAMALISSMALPRGITVTLEIDAADAHARVSADRERLKQAILNLLSNAVKFNRPSGFVKLKLERASARWRVTVADSGCGIAEDKLPQLFVPFQRSGPNDGAHQGTGLGLALSQKLISAFGGQISVTSTVNVGSTFTVELLAADANPRAELPPAEIADTPPAKPEAPPQRCVLYVEDDVANFYLLERILQSRKDIRLVSALQGSLGLELARSQKPDLILLDLNLPDMNGEQLLRALKADSQTAGIPVIAVTGEVGTNRPETLRSLGALGTLVKPYRVQELTKLVDEALANVTVV
jgi:signal transduction histidine kinase/CheY-like chemotaxis protein